jgi:hypothetical protein
MTVPAIQEPDNVSPVPDKATKKGLPDHTGSGKADGRIMHVNLGFARYGTDDKSHAAAMVITFILLVFLALLIIFAPENDQNKELIGWIKGAVLLTVGVAIGQGGSNTKPDHE